jgi:hypothetical protein
MGKGLRLILCSILTLGGSHAYSEQIVEWKDTGASTKLDFLLGDNRAYRCYVKDRTTFDFTVGIFGISRYENLKREIAEKGKSLPPEESIIGFEYETIEKGKRVGPLIREWALLDYISPPPNRIGHKATISLSDGESLTFELFSQVPEWPFTTRERLKPYFYLYRDGQKLKCGGVKQLD